MKNIESYLNLQVPSALSWSPDGKSLAFQLTGAKGSRLCLYSFQTHTIHTLVNNIPPFRLYKDLPAIHWTNDSKSIIFNAGQVFKTINLDSQENVNVLVDTSLLGEVAALSPSLDYLSFIRDGDLWVLPLKAGSPSLGVSPIRLTQREGLLTGDWQLFSRLVQHPQWSPDSQKIAYLSPMQSGYKVRIVSVMDGLIHEVVPSVDRWGFSILNWSPDSRYLAICRLSEDFQRKELLLYNLEEERQQLIWEDEDERWVDHNIHPGYDVAWRSDSSALAFLSNRSGWRHLYTYHLVSKEIHQITSGEYDCYWCSWSPADTERLAYVSSQQHLQERHLYLMDTARETLPMCLSSDKGICTGGWFLRQANFSWSPNGKSIAYVFSGSGVLPEIRVASCEAPAAETTIFSSLTPDLPSDFGMHFEPVSFQSADSFTVHGALLTSSCFDCSIRHPALVFAYGAWDQEAQLGWDFAPKNLLFNYLANNGYVVLLVDPRGSEGYGDAHSKAQYHEGGRKQCDDLVSAASFLSSLGWVDSHRIALFGYSYGGYLVLQTLVHAPQVFAAGISMAPVSEWATYAGYSTYANIRFGKPDEKPNPLVERSPLYHAHRIQAPLLILHGTQDFNVPILSSEVFVSALLRLGKPFEYMAYPREGHVWTQPGTIRDFLWRIKRFLDINMSSTEEA